MLNFDNMTTDPTALAVVFPGQGSQSIGMLKALAEHYPIVTETFDIASRITGFDCWALAQQGPEAVLNQTENTQPVLLAADIAVWRVLYERPNTNTNLPKPAWLAGHSLGEYAALVAAQAMRFEDAIKIVALRGLLMQAAVPEGQGAMAAILGLDNALIEQACDQINAQNQQANQFIRVSPANYNAIGQTVIAGHTQAVTQAIELMKAKGAKRAILLPVSVPSHCDLMRPAADALLSSLAKIDIQKPLIPILHNSDVRSHLEANEIKRVLGEQLYNPVRWVETIETLSAYGITDIIECGPGKVLSGLIKRINNNVQVHNI